MPEEAVRLVTRLLTDGFDDKLVREDKDFDAIRDYAGIQKLLGPAKR